MTNHGNTTWIEVNTNALRHNFSEIQTVIGPSVRIMTVVKADAYGHGIVEASKVFVEAGASYMGVTTIEEGLALRNAGITAPTLIFSPLLPDQVEAAVASYLDMTVCDLASAEVISKATERIGIPARVHVKVDTGMGRLGVNPDDCPDLMYRIVNLPGIEIAGVYTHFATSGDKNLTHAWKQNGLFTSMVSKLKAKDIPVGICHAANSATMLNLGDSYHDMVRPGTILYGQYPSQHTFKRLDLCETWVLKTRVISLKKLRVGEMVGYGSEFKATKPTVAAVIPIGYSDGFAVMPESIARRAAEPMRIAANKLMGVKSETTVIINGKRVKVIGRISMQMCSVDVTDISSVHVGDEVIVPARRTTISSRIPRIYI